MSDAFTIHNPYDRSVIEKRLHTTADETESMLAAACGYRPPPIHERAAILRRSADKLEAQAETFAERIAREGGKPLTDARTEVARAVWGMRYCASHVADLLAGARYAPGINALFADKTLDAHRSPKGVVLAISAFNHPLNLIVHQAIPAIAVGAPVIIKPSLKTPLSAIALLEVLRACGLPEDAAQIALLDNDAASALAADARLAHLSFIGSEKVGFALKRSLADHVTCTLEHGGAAPALLLPDADFDAAIPKLAKGAMAHAGQVCVSTQRVFVPWAEAASVSRALAEACEAMRHGNPLNDTTEIGPLITPEALSNVHAMVQDAIAHGGKVLCGGEAATQTCYLPTVILDASAQARLSREEVFGPVVAVYGYDDEDDAIARANALPFAFQASLWSRSAERLHTVGSRIKATTLIHNDSTLLRADHMPFGGFERAGFGLGGLGHTMQDYTRERLIIA